MGKDRAIDTQASEYSSLRRRQTESAGSQGDGRNSFHIENRLPMECFEWNRYLLKQHSPFTIPGMGKSRSFSETLEDGFERLRRIKRDWLVMAIDGWRHDKSPAWRGKKPAQTLRTGLKKALSEVCLLKVTEYRSAWRLMELIDMIAKWQRRRKSYSAILH